MAVFEEMITLQSGAFGLVGMLHRPEKSPRAAFVFCYPFGDERKSSCRAFAQTARAFAEAGMAVLRFDYRGCGDSGGDFSEATLEGWLEDAQAAVAALKSRTGARAIGFLGLRFGAMLAACAAEKEPDAAHLILWEPILDGRSYFAADLRKKLIKEMMTRGKSSGRRTDLLEQLERGEGYIDMDGYKVTGALYAGLAALNLPSRIGRFPGRCFLCQVSFTDKVGIHVNSLKEAYVKGGATAEIGAVVEEPFWSKVDFAGCPKLIAATMDWLGRAVP